MDKPLLQYSDILRQRVDVGEITFGYAVWWLRSYGVRKAVAYDLMRGLL